ncbi:magnesium transporter [Aliibacillus thermotolerans]|uniref:Magnesium transporter MgtE n=1 Tax=Aliibacillus thermotolerans TaxID=1834418 RepID=A0ABW0U2U6_9BACI|nr:magnesium transporter [Aliibacillus thermotolerans]MDA3129241.1 magnesium transporter [Aliibacillus thermotolerans]
MVKLNEQTREEYIEQIILSLQQQDVDTFRHLFLELHPMDQTDVFLRLQTEERMRVYEYISPDEFAEIFEGLEIEEQKTIVLELHELYAAEMFNHMFADNVADFLSEVKENSRTKILQAMNKEEAEDVRELLTYEEETAGAIMTKEFIAIKKTDTVEEVIEQLRREGPAAETIYYLYVVDRKGLLVGVTSIRDLITSHSDEKIEDIMSTQVVSVHVKTDQEEVAQIIQKYDFLAAPVVTDHNLLVGIVTVDDVIDVLEEETTEDFGEITASRGSTDVSLTSFQAARKRAPWIILLMFFGLLTAEVIGQFEETLEAVVLLAAFIPMIMGSAGNTGTQSLAVSVRALATGTLEKKGWGKTFLREFSTGLLIGLMAGIVIMVLLALIYQEMLIGIIVGVSIILSLGMASVIGTIVPLVIDKLKLDPAIASGPFITTLNDVISLLIYFTVATSLLQYL